MKAESIRKLLNSSTFRDFTVLKVKGPNATADVDADDPDYFAEQLPLNAGEYTIAGAAAGTYTFAVVNPTHGRVLASAAFVAGGGDSEADVAEGITDAINAALAADEALTRYVDSAVYVSGDEFRVNMRQQGVPVRVVLTAPGGTWLPQSVTDSTGTGELWPAAYEIPHVERGGEGPNMQAEVTVVGIDVNGDVVPPQGTYSMEFVQEVDRYNDAGELARAIVTRGEDTGAAVGSVHTVQCNGGRLGVRMHTIAGESASVDRWEILIRGAVA